MTTKKDIFDLMKEECKPSLAAMMAMRMVDHLPSEAIASLGYWGEIGAAYIDMPEGTEGIGFTWETSDFEQPVEINIYDDMQRVHYFHNKNGWDWINIDLLAADPPEWPADLLEVWQNCYEDTLKHQEA